jgi:hypothetical protein
MLALAGLSVDFDYENCYLDKKLLVEAGVPDYATFLDDKSVLIRVIRANPCSYFPT